MIVSYRCSGRAGTYLAVQSTNAMQYGVLLFVLQLTLYQRVPATMVHGTLLCSSFPTCSTFASSFDMESSHEQVMRWKLEVERRQEFPDHR
jgi:hypothetical protein